jgi:DNA-binding XRE family transcriptional regulator
MTPTELIAARKKRAEVLRARRINARISKAIFSKQTGLSRTTIDIIESGQKPWNIDSEIIYMHALQPIT